MLIISYNLLKVSLMQTSLSMSRSGPGIAHKAGTDVKCLSLVVTGRLPEIWRFSLVLALSDGLVILERPNVGADLAS